MAINLRNQIPLAGEIEQILLADIVLILAFDLTLIGGAANLSHGGINVFLYFLPIAAIGVTLSFVLHELMHKFVAQRFGAVAAFMTSTIGLAITALTGIFGFLIGIPGATVIYTNNFTVREEGIVSLAGPLTNFAVFLVFLAAGTLLFPNFLSHVTSTLSGEFIYNSYLQNVINFTLFISILLAFFNMIPLFPLDGSKILRWNKVIYVVVIAAIFLLFITIIPLYSFVEVMAFWLVIAFVFSMLYRGIGI